MKKILYILIAINISICSNVGLGLIKNVILPGWGIADIKGQEHKKNQYILREVIIWSTLFTSRENSHIFENNYINYSIDYASTDVSDFDSQYSINVGNYNSIFSYNDVMLRKRLPDNVYPENQGYDWNWDTSSNRLKYKSILQISRDLDKIGDFAIAGLLIHRLVGAINYLYLVNTNKDLGLSSNVSKPDSHTIQLDLKFDL